jgi:hypothetical protein
MRFIPQTPRTEPLTLDEQFAPYTGKARRFYHGTNVELINGTLLESPATRATTPNFTEAAAAGYASLYSDLLVYLSSKPEDAHAFAVEVAKRKGGAAIIYEACPLGKLYRDPEEVMLGSFDGCNRRSHLACVQARVLRRLDDLT